MGKYRENELRLTPLDIQSHRFARTLRGCDPEEVEGFLRLVAEDFERIVRQSEERKERVRHCEEQLKEMCDREETLRRTLTTAQEVSDDLRQTAAREAEVMIAEAEVKAEKVLDTAHRRIARLSEDIRQMKGLRTRLSAAVRNTIETHLALLESLNEDDGESSIVDGKVAFLAQVRRTPSWAPRKAVDGAKPQAETVRSEASLSSNRAIAETAPAPGA